jgi:hypothetical protein
MPTRRATTGPLAMPGRGWSCSSNKRTRSPQRRRPLVTLLRSFRSMAGGHPEVDQARSGPPICAQEVELGLRPAPRSADRARHLGGASEQLIFPALGARPTTAVFPTDAGGKLRCKGSRRGGCGQPAPAACGWHDGLKSDIAPCPKSVNCGSGCSPFVSACLMLRSLDRLWVWEAP